MIATSVHSQDIYNKSIQFLKNNKDYYDVVFCYNSTLIVKAEYFEYKNSGYVIVYMKQNDYDSYGKPYIFCNVSDDRWRKFVNGGVVSWGSSYHTYLKNYICNTYDLADLNFNYANKNNYTPESSINSVLINDVLQKKQTKYDNNLIRIQNYLDDVQIYINNINDPVLKYKIDKRFSAEVLDILNFKNYDYSKSNVTQSVLDFIYNKITEIKKDESTKNYNLLIKQKELVSSTKFTTDYSKSKLSSELIKYIGSHNVDKISIYYSSSNNNFFLDKVINVDATIILSEDLIEFKKNKFESLLHRQLIFIKFNVSSGFYLYSSSFGDTHISKDFSQVIFFDKPDKSGNIKRKYVYNVKN